MKKMKSKIMCVSVGLIFLIPSFAVSANTTNEEVKQDNKSIQIQPRYLPIPSMPGWRGQGVPWWWTLNQSNFSDAYSSFYNATH